MENKAAKLISSALLGLDMRSVLINGVPYVIHPPTIKQIAGAAFYLSEISEAQFQSMNDVFESLENVEVAAHALSIFIAGDDSLFETFCQAELGEVTEALSEAVSLISVQNFTTLLALSKSVAGITAKSKPSETTPSLDR